MANTTLGTVGAIEQPSSYGFTQGKGSFSKRSWKITNPSSVVTLVSQLAAAGYSYEVTNGQYITVEARAEQDPSSGDPANTPLQDIWERVGVVSEKDILESDTTAISSISSEDLDIIKREIDSPNSTGTNPWVWADSSNKYKLFKLLYYGVKNARVWQPVVKHSYITASTYSVKWSDLNVGKIISTSKMYSLEGCPAAVLFNLPTQSPNRTDISLSAGWYKRPASVQQLAGGQWQITQEYEFGYWPDLIYTLA
jgi:hypothetical protein